MSVTFPRLLFVFAFFGLLVVGCSSAEEPLTIKDAEKAGFSTDQQQAYQMVQAIDGWSGKWKGEKVELYEFEDADSVKTASFENATKEGNLSGWQEMCVVRNMLMLSKGEKACGELRGLAE